VRGLTNPRELVGQVFWHDPTFRLAAPMGGQDRPPYVMGIASGICMMGGCDAKGHYIEDDRGALSWALGQLHETAFGTFVLVGRGLPKAGTNSRR
jgi:hypothetical protein